MKNFQTEGDKAYHAKNYKKALDSYTQALRLEPNNLQVLVNAAYCYLNLFQFDKAVELANIAIGIDANSVDSYIILAYSYGNIGKLPLSRASANKAKELSPDSDEVLCCYGTVFIFENNFQDAIPYLKEATILNPKMQIANINLIVCYNNINDIDNAYNQSKAFFSNSPSIRSSTLLLSQFFHKYIAIRIIILLLPVVYIFYQNILFFTPHFVYIFLYIYNAIASYKMKSVKHAQLQFFYAVILLVLDIIIISSY